MNKYWISISVFYLVVSFECFGQSCNQNLTEAKRSFFDGQFDKINILIADCYQHQLNKSDKIDALELLINANLMLNKKQKADQYLNELLTLEPLYETSESDLIEFKELHNSYSIKTKFNIGFQLGANFPKYQVLQYNSIASITEEPNNYESNIGLVIGLKGEWFFWKNFFISSSVLYQSFNYNQQETIMGFQDVFVSEKMNVLVLPFQLGYEFSTPILNIFINAGISPHLLLSSKANLELFGIDSEQRTTLTGIPRKATDYDISNQRKNATLNYVFGGGIRKNFGLYAVEISAFYEYGLNNLIEESERYSDQNLWRTYSYVPDDFKMDHFKISLGIIKSFVYPKKLKK
ncbi:MAG: PorT family protein [Reichenbachiella sp.]